MKKITALVLVLLLGMTALAGCGGGDDGADTSLQDVLDKGVLSCAISPDYAPYEYLDLVTGEVKGSDVVLVQYIAEQLGVKLQLKQMSFESCLAAVENNSCDISASNLSWTPERAETMCLSSYYNMDSSMAQTILVMGDKADQFKTAEDFKGMKIAAQNGTIQWSLASDQIPDVQVQTITDMGEGVLLLIEGKVDGMVVQVDVGESYVENYPDVAIPDFLFENEEAGNVIASAKGNDALIDKISEIINQVEEDGLYAQWLEEATEDAAAQGLLD